MIDKILVRDDTDGLTPTRTYDWFRDHGYYWAVTETIDGFSSYVVTHVSTGMAVPFSRGESPEAAKEAYFEGIVEYDQETIDDLVSEFDEIPNHRVCPHCEGDGFVDESPEQTGEKVRELEGKVEQLRKALLSLLSNSRYVLRSEEPVDPRLWQALSASISTAEDALSGGGDDHASS